VYGKRTDIAAKSRIDAKKGAHINMKLYVETTSTLCKRNAILDHFENTKVVAYLIYKPHGQTAKVRSFEYKFSHFRNGVK